jgi:hypothetical protein
MLALINNDRVLMQAQNKLKSRFTIFFQKNSAFVSRNSILTTIRKKLEQTILHNHDRMILIDLKNVE